MKRAKKRKYRRTFVELIVHAFRKRTQAITLNVIKRNALYNRLKNGTQLP